MNIKVFIKSILGVLNCFRYGIRNHGKNVYIGFGTKCIGGKYMYIGNNVSIRPDSFINCNSDGIFRIGNNSDIGCRSRLSAANSLIIGNSVLTGPNVFISDCDHRYDQVGIPIMNQGIVGKQNKVAIDDDVWIGTNCVIVGNVHIGKGSVIGSNSVVTKDIPDYCVAVGSPCKVIKKYNFATEKWERV